MKKNRNRNSWISFGRVLVVIFLIVLFINALSLFTQIKRDLTYANRAYGLSAMNDLFEEGEYYEIFEYTIKNEMTDEKPYVDTSQYEAFGRWYNAYLKSRMYPDDQGYKDQMAAEKQKISWKKILTVINSLEKETN